MFRSFSRAATVAALIASVLLGLTDAAPAAAVGPVSTFEVQPRTYCVSGYGAPSTTLTIRLRTGSGDLLAKRVLTTDASTGWWTSCLGVDILPTDELSANDGSNLRTFVVPEFTLKVNRVTDVLSGVGPANEQIVLDVAPCHGWQGCDTPVEHTMTSSSAGAFSYDFTALHNFRGGDGVSGAWTSPFGDLVGVFGSAPNMSVTVAGADVTGRGTPGTLVTFTLRNAAGTKIASGRDIADEDGAFAAPLSNAAGSWVRIAVGNKVIGSFASDAKMTVKSFAVNASAAADTISATCFPNADFQVTASDPATPPAHTPKFTQVAGVADGAGHLSADMTAGLFPGFDLMSGDQYSVSCLNAKGDVQRARGEVP